MRNVVIRICDFVEQSVKKLLRIRIVNSISDNRQSKTCGELSRTIKNRKLVRSVALVLTFVFGGARRILRGQNSEGGQACRSASGAADEVRVRHQPADR